MRKIRSISVKIMGTVLVAILITSILNSIVTTSSVKKDYQNMISHYVEDTVHGYGSLMGEFVDEFGEDTYSNEEVKKSLGNIHIYDLDSSYAYVVSTDGIMLYHPTAEKIGQPVENEVVTGIVADLKAGKSHELDVVEYKFFLREAFIYNCSQTEEVIEYLRNAKRLETSEPERDKLRQRMNKG